MGWEQPEGTYVSNPIRKVGWYSSETTIEMRHIDELVDAESGPTATRINRLRKAGNMREE